MFDIALLEPEIPPNTGNIIRLCANAGARLHLIEPLGFSMEDRALKRAGLDYHEYATVVVHRSYAEFRAACGDRRVFGFSTHAKTSLYAARFEPGDVLLFGSESRGLPAAVRDGLECERLLRIPMVASSRSLNLSNAAAIALYEAWRQCGLAGSGN
jgi:tRNA (cytidine/uridine-2'-O-)-methyltransferase